MFKKLNGRSFSVDEVENEREGSGSSNFRKENVEKRKLKKISVLKNSYKYFIEHALIISYGDCYRLLIIHEWELLTDQYYKSPKGAKIAFLKFYENRCWKKGVEAEWSDFYEPGIAYLDQISNKIKI